MGKLILILNVLITFLKGLQLQRNYDLLRNLNCI